MEKMGGEVATKSIACIWINLMNLSLVLHRRRRTDTVRTTWLIQELGYAERGNCVSSPVCRAPL